MPYLNPYIFFIGFFLIIALSGATFIVAGKKKLT
jgi:hypothetical protein